MGRSCCGNRGVRIIKIANSKAGLTGLDQLLEDVYREGWRPGQPGLEERLISGVRAAGNYIEPGFETVYAKSLEELYRSFLAEGVRRDDVVKKTPGPKAA